MKKVKAIPQYEESIGNFVLNVPENSGIELDQQNNVIILHGTKMEYMPEELMKELLGWLRAQKAEHLLDGFLDDVYNFSLVQILAERLREPRE